VPGGCVKVKEKLLKIFAAAYFSGVMKRR